MVELVDDTLLQRNDGIVGNVNIFGADFGATLRDVAEADAEVVLEQAGAIERIQRMKLEAGDTDEKARTAEFGFGVVLTKDVADVLAKKTLDTFAEFLHAVY